MAERFQTHGLTPTLRRRETHSNYCSRSVPIRRDNAESEQSSVRFAGGHAPSRITFFAFSCALFGFPMTNPQHISAILPQVLSDAKPLWLRLAERDRGAT